MEEASRQRAPAHDATIEIASTAGDFDDTATPPFAHEAKDEKNDDRKVDGPAHCRLLRGLFDYVGRKVARCFRILDESVLIHDGFKWAETLR